MSYLSAERLIIIKHYDETTKEKTVNQWFVSENHA